jgi:hypothetical protein
MPRFLKIFLAFIAGLVVGEAIRVVGYILATNYFGLFDRDGGGAMGAIFILGPFLAVSLAIVFAVVVARRTRAA